MHQLSQEICMRWSSTFYMLERFLEQQCAITTVLPDTTCSAELTITQWNMVNQLVLLLQSFKEFFREFEHEDAGISLVIKDIRLLTKHVNKPVTTEESLVIKLFMNNWHHP